MRPGVSQDALKDSAESFHRLGDAAEGEAPGIHVMGGMSKETVGSSWRKEDSLGV